MRQYVIDEMRLDDFDRVKAHLDKRFEASEVEGVYWIELDEDVLSDEQKRHRECRPHCFAVELTPGALSVELLVRSKTFLKCACMAYADPRQRRWLMDRVDAIFEKLEISV
ncbi:conserved hypothetical protein [Candidatus Desulfarcum epimagneticum]|uniref:Uncharacterized protein n=1 Tax=uncultured Desulfobacteraceae bacterium TaxID=218296 RepID=A0A484HKH9_9BACT|nr:conserved hypothetical protein [uncultured Desulfobacteraceae bacterium]